MKLLIVNPIMYTSEGETVERLPSIKDTMMYDLCLAFLKLGIDVTLFAGEPYKPVKAEEYPFKIIWAECKYKKIFKPHAIPYCPEIKKVIKATSYDLIISSEVLSLNTFILSQRAADRLIIWHELAHHHKIAKQIPSKIWYGVVARLFMRKPLIVARSNEAKEFISRFCPNVSEEIIEHGVNFDKFNGTAEKEDYFVVSARLIESKKIHKTINVFSKFLKNSHQNYTLKILGDGNKRDFLEQQVKSLGIEKNVEFYGMVTHEEMCRRLAKARALLIYTVMDNNMISIIEAIACGVPIVTTSVPLNSSYIISHKLGIVDDNWDENDLEEIINNQKEYVENCFNYRYRLSTESKAKAFLRLKTK